MAENRTDRGGYDVWEEFAREHDIEGIILHAMAAIQAEGGAAMPPSEALAVPEPTDVTEGLSEEEVAGIVDKVTDIQPRLLGYNGASSVMAFAVTNGLRDMLLDAWDHYTDHACEPAGKALDRFVEQLIGAMHMARGRTEGGD